MSINELKYRIIAQINDTNNEDLLYEISTMLYIESKSVAGVYQMSDAEREAVEDGIRQIENGQWISHEESNKRFEELLKKYENKDAF